jgi:hypothetical protein
MENNDYVAFLNVKDLLYKVAQSGKLTNECRIQRDLLIKMLCELLYGDILVASQSDEKGA